jgi:hypothetical protein
MEAAGARLEMTVGQREEDAEREEVVVDVAAAAYLPRRPQRTS